MELSNHFITYQGSDCLLACVQNYFKNRELNICESEIFLLGDGFNTTYRRFIKGNTRDFGIKSDVFGSVFGFCRTNGISFRFYRDMDEAAAEKILCEKLAVGDSIIAMVDPGHLDYSPIFLNGYGLIHFINITGIGHDSQFEKVHICDGFIPTYPASNFSGWVDYKIIKEARKVNGNAFVELDCSSFNSDFYDERKRKGLIKRKLKENLLRYLDGQNKGDEFYGTTALREFCRDIPGFLDNYADDFTNRMVKMNYEMKIYGLITSRQLLCKVLNNMNLIENDRWNHEIRHMENIVRKWDGISLKVVKAGMSKQQSQLESISYQIREILIDEIVLYQNICNRIHD